jgi:hypothetical protein
MPAPLMRLIVTGAAPLVTTVAPGGTIPMSLARIERTGPMAAGTLE